MVLIKHNVVIYLVMNLGSRILTTLKTFTNTSSSIMRTRRAVEQFTCTHLRDITPVWGDDDVRKRYKGGGERERENYKREQEREREEKKV